mgnify:CR=1 FL=1
MKTTFKKGDQVFDIRFGWGVVIFMYSFDWGKEQDTKLVCVVKFEDGEEEHYTKQLALKLLSFTKYTLVGFTQEPEDDYSEYIGKWGKFWNYDSGNDLMLSTLYFYNTDNDYKFITNNDEAYEYFEPLTEEEIKILKLENYERDNSTYNREKGE